MAGCATGEEAYSIAMLLAEYASSMADAPRIQVFASDLDERAIAVAREGFYTEAEVADVSHERLQRFFSRETGGYRVRRELRGAGAVRDRTISSRIRHSRISISWPAETCSST